MSVGPYFPDCTRTGRETHTGKIPVVGTVATIIHRIKTTKGNVKQSAS